MYKCRHKLRLTYEDNIKIVLRHTGYEGMKFMKLVQVSVQI
jgi:hypothetical protein